MLPCCPPGLPQLPWFHALHRLQDQSPFAVACTTSRDPTSGVISLSPRSPHHAPGPALPPSSPFSLSYPHVLPLSPGGFGPGPIQAYPSWVFSTQKQLQGFSSKLTLDQATSLCRTSDCSRCPLDRLHLSGPPPSDWRLRKHRPVHSLHPTHSHQPSQSLQASALAPNIRFIQIVKRIGREFRISPFNTFSVLRVCGDVSFFIADTDNLFLLSIS